MTDNERKESISALRQLLAMCDFVDQYGNRIVAAPYFNAVETAIESLNETSWIPVSDRLPIPPMFCLITTDGSHGDVIDIALYMSDGWHKASEVLAWMPLPKPYREDGK